MGVSYNVGYAIAIALRYIPDVQSDFTKIKHAQEARGIEMSNKTSLWTRIKRMSTIIFPLLFSSMDRIDVVSNAMELRGFGKNKKRTWYMGKKLSLIHISEPTRLRQIGCCAPGKWNQGMQRIFSSAAERGMYDLHTGK